MKKALLLAAFVAFGGVAAYAAGEYPDLTVGDFVAPAASGGSSVGDANTLTLNATGKLRWSSGTQLFSSADGVLRVSNAADSSPTSLASGIQFGSSSVGASLVYDSVNGLRSMNFNRTANLGFAASGYTLTNADGTIKFGTATTGVGVGSNILTLATSSTSQVTVAATGDVTFTQTVKVQNAATIRSGSAAPEGAVTGSVGDIYLRTGGGAGTTFCVKESGAASTTGWICK